MQNESTEPSRHRAPSWRSSLIYLAIAGMFAGFALARSLAHRGAPQRADSLAASNLVSTPNDLAAVGPDERVLVTDLANHTRDPELASAITEALRVDLEQSRRLHVIFASPLQDTLRIATHAVQATLSDSLAREIAVRDGAKALVGGDVDELGAEYTISVRLVDVQSGEIVDTIRETAHDSTQVIDAVDRVSLQLRTRLGDGLTLIQSSAPLEQVMTPSITALHAYSRGMRAAEREGNPAKAIVALEKAVAVDPHFAMAYRKLAVELDRLGSAHHAKALEATDSAFRNRERLSDRDRFLTMGAYYQNVGEAEKAVAAYRAVLEQYPREIQALNNLGFIDMRLKHFRDAEEIRRRALAADSTMPGLYDNLAQALFSEGKYDETARVLVVARTKFPDFAPAMWTEISLAAVLGNFALAEQRAHEAIGHAGNVYARQVEALELSSALALVQGRIAESDSTTRHLLELMRQKNEPSDYLERSAYLAFSDTWYHHAPGRALERLDAALEKYPLANIPVGEGHADWLAYNYALAGRPDRARDILTQYRAAHPMLAIGDRGKTERAVGAALLADHKLADAQATLRQAQTDYWCPTCTLPDLARAYDLDGAPDSAIAIYTRYLTTPWVRWLQSDGEFHEFAYHRLGELYEARADTARALDSYRHAIALWADADAELQPEVKAMRAKVVALEARR